MNAIEYFITPLPFGEDLAWVPVVKAKPKFRPSLSFGPWELVSWDEAAALFGVAKKALEMRIRKRMASEFGTRGAKNALLVGYYSAIRDHLVRVKKIGGTLYLWILQAPTQIENVQQWRKCLNPYCTTVFRPDGRFHRFCPTCEAEMDGEIDRLARATGWTASP